MRDERLREGITMALYLSLSLLAVLLALPTEREEGSWARPALTVLVTAVGLMAAHLVAFRISSRYIRGGRLDQESLELVGAQVVGGATVTMLAVLPIAVFGAVNGVIVAELLLLAVIAVVSYLAAGGGPGQRLRALGYVAGVAIVTVVVIWIKGLVGH